MTNILKKIFYYFFIYIIIALAYLYFLVVFDEVENENLIYNYEWNFQVIDKILWFIFPLSFTVIYIALVVKFIFRKSKKS